MGYIEEQRVNFKEVLTVWAVLGFSTYTSELISSAEMTLKGQSWGGLFNELYDIEAYMFYMVYSSYFLDNFLWLFKPEFVILAFTNVPFPIGLDGQHAFHFTKTYNSLGNNVFR